MFYEFFFLSLIILIFFFFIEKKIGYTFFPFDNPDNFKKKHLRPTALSGGIYICAFIISVFTFFYFFYNENLENFKIIIIMSILSFFIGLYDDKYYFQPSSKLLLNGVVVLFFVINYNFLNITSVNSSILNMKLSLGFYSFFFSTFCFLLLINALNMTDGINSLTVGISIIWLTSILYFFNPSYLKLIIFIILFLIYIFFKIYHENFFLGDNGTHLLSTFIGGIIIYEYNLQPSKIYVEEIFLILSIPGIDMLRLFIQRIYNKKNPFLGDRNHLHHLLIDNFNLKTSLIIYYSIMIIPIFLSKILIKNDVFSILLILFLYFILIIYLKLKKSLKST